MIRVCTFCIYLIFFITFSNFLLERGSSTNTMNKVHEMGYPVEMHYTRTKDNYKLGLERIPYGKFNNQSGTGKPVLLLHGLWCNSLIFALNNYSSLALALADAGFDVWLYNSRGVGPSRVKNLNKMSWKYSYHELGIYDLPAVIDYILETTNKKKLDVIGYSLGSTIMLVLLSEKPEYNDKLRNSIMVAPAARMKNKGYILALIRYFAPAILDFLSIVDFWPYTKNPDLSLQLIQKYCGDNRITLNNCKLIVNYANGINTNTVADTMVLAIMGAFPQPFSSTVLKHYVQMIDVGKFQKYDYGTSGNMKKYKTEGPPLYNLTKVTAPTIIIHSLTDTITNPEDVNWLKKHLNNVLKLDMYTITGVPFGHLSYPTASNSKEIVVDYIINKLNDPDNP